MELNFLGRGSAFNPKEGNTSAFFIENKNMFLIDCGESVFEKIMKYKLLENINSINLIITHTHSDHIGSIGTLAMYSYYLLSKPLFIVIPENDEHKQNIQNILTLFGCDSSMYVFLNESNYDNKYNCFKSIRYIETKHSKNLNCYSILFDTDNGLVFYSGDTYDISTLRFLIEGNATIDKIYLDTTTDNYPGNVHLNIELIKQTIPNYLKNRTYCMHFNCDECIKRAEEYGFNVIQTIKKKKLEK